MAAEIKEKKRKGGNDAAASTKKRKSDAPTSKPPTTELKTPPESKKPAKASSTSRKRASDFFDANEDDERVAAPAVQEPKAKKAKTADGVAGQKDSAAKKVRAKSTIAAPPEKTSAESAEAEDVWADSEDDDIASQSAALLRGFGSSDDEDDEEDGAVVEVPAIPTNKELAKKLKAASGDEEDGVGVIYVGRVPHGFYEHQMRAYFSQFGEIKRLRLSRNKKTGHSKHYAFIEFGSREVAKIVAATMNKYLLFGHILQVRTLAPEEVHPELFKGANKRFKAIPRNKIEGRQLRLPKERDAWEKRIETESKRRRDKEEKLKMLGYEYKAPDLTTTKAIPFRKQATEETPLLTDKPHQEEAETLPKSKPKKSTDSKDKTKGAGSEGKTRSKASKVKSTIS